MHIPSYSQTPNDTNFIRYVVRTNNFVALNKYNIFVAKVW